MEELSRANFGATIYQAAKSQNVSLDKIAKAIGCSNKTIERLTTARSHPTDEMLKQGGILLALGYERYAKLSDAEKEKISEGIGAVGGGVLGLGSVTAVVSSLGVAGLSAAGVTSGLAALGALVGGGMAAGITVAAAIPVAAAVAGYGAIKGVKAAVEHFGSKQEALDPKWEHPIG